jgi:hypothetical protein
MSTRRLEKLVEEKILELHKKRYKFLCLIDIPCSSFVRVEIYVKDTRSEPYYLERSLTIRVSKDLEEAANEIFLGLLFGG